MERNHQNYFGRTTSVFVDLGVFEFTLADLRTEFHGWANVESFERGASPLPFLTQIFRLDGESFLNFKNANKDVFDSMTDTILSLVNIKDGDGWTLEHFKINTTEYNFILIAEKSGERRRVETQSGTQYDQTIAENLELVQNVLVLNWTLGIEKSEWLAGLAEAK